MMTKTQIQTRYGLRGVLFFPALLFLFLAAAIPAQAQICETAADAQTYTKKMGNDMLQNLKDEITQETNIQDNKFEMMQKELLNRLDQFNTNIPAVIARWWTEMEPAMKKMAEQLHVARIDQTTEIGKFFDAEMLNERALAIQKEKVDAERRYRPNELSCQVDSAALGETSALAASHAFTHAYGTQDTSRRDNDAMGVDNQGRAKRMKNDWDEYETYFCDPALGDQGCKDNKAGSLPGENRNIAFLLWGPKQTLDLSDPDTRRIVDASIRALISPTAPDPVPVGVVDQPSGHMEILRRQAREARLNAIYNTLVQMIAERASPTNTNAFDMRSKGGVEPKNISNNASYREIQETMIQDRFRDPQYIARMIDDPEQLTREQGAIGALSLQVMRDLYKRMEEMVFMQAATFATTLDHNEPGSSAASVPIK